MSSMTRSIKRGIIFKNMNKQQRASYRSATPEGRKEFERELGEKLKERRFIFQEKRRFLTDERD